MNIDSLLRLKQSGKF